MMSTPTLNRGTSGAHLTFCEPMAEYVAPDGALIVLMIYSTEISPLTGLAEMPLNEQRQMLKRRRRGIFVVIKLIKSPAPLGVIYSEYKKDAPVP